ncbi:hypothetical protein GO495_29775 [Chitinophaga oryziterrae]|uniref:Uncharacterized protein n=1 Tax=Chitinophaga oryziterrae TaxID=1031224 RepID=A0A6N8JKR0_9BACT|nr:hypothetical protein [Chitinophaga oryziterrae]MVT44818.1 hypothetical protein [Chitinophaga oryziterrae]
MTVGFTDIFARGIQPQTPNLTFSLTVEMTAGSGSYFKDVMSVLTRVTGKLFSSLFSSPFHRNSRLLLDVTPAGTFFIGMAHSLSVQVSYESYTLANNWQIKWLPGDSNTSSTKLLNRLIDAFHC